MSCFGVIPKRHQPGKWHLILDLSSPAGHSVNDGIAGKHFSLHRMDVDEITAGMRLGWGSLMAKLDVQMHTTLCQPIQSIAGCRVLNEVLPLMLMRSCPSGFRSAPYIFTCIVNVVDWVAKQNYDVTFLMHYLDDLVLPAPLSVNTIWKCLLTVYLNLETPPSRQTRRAINVRNHSGH